MKTRLLASVALAVVAVAACGGKQTPPPAMAEADSGSDTPSGFSEDAGEPAAPADSAGSGSSDTSGAAAAAAEPKDECTPIGVDFEKRARPKLKECYRAGKKKNAALEGTVKIEVDVNTSGKIATTKITEKTLPDHVAKCMLKVVKATPMPEAAKCPGKAITIPITFPTPR